MFRLVTRAQSDSLDGHRAIDDVDIEIERWHVF